MENSKSIKNYCRKCLSSTNHKVLFKKVDSVDVNEDNIHFSYTYFVLSCFGCEVITYRTDYDDIDNVQEGKNGEYINYTDTKVFPPVIANHKKLKNYYYLPKQIRILYEETLQCISLNCKIVAASAFRSIVEGVCQEQKITGKDLKEKIKKMGEQGIISKNDVKRLHSIRFMGNDAVHRLDTVKDEKIFLVLRIIEHLLESLYLLPREGQDILETTIDNLEDLKKILRRSIRTSKFLVPVPLQEILGTSYRRVEDHIFELETELINEIKKGKFPLLSLSQDIKTKNGKNINYYNTHMTLSMLAGVGEDF